MDLSGYKPNGLGKRSGAGGGGGGGWCNGGTRTCLLGWGLQHTFEGGVGMRVVAVVAPRPVWWGRAFNTQFEGMGEWWWGGGGGGGALTHSLRVWVSGGGWGGGGALTHSLRVWVSGGGGGGWGWGFNTQFEGMGGGALTHSLRVWVSGGRALTHSLKVWVSGGGGGGGGGVNTVWGYGWVGGGGGSGP